MRIVTICSSSSADDDRCLRRFGSYRAVSAAFASPLSEDTRIIAFRIPEFLSAHAIALRDCAYTDRYYDLSPESVADEQGHSFTVYRP